MKVLFILLLVFQFMLMGCKQEVGFTSVEHSELEEPPVVFEAQGPTIRVLQAPRDQMVDETNQIVFEVLKGDAEIEEVVCSINSIPLPCDWVSGVMKIIPMPMGEHVFEITAIDVDGLKDYKNEFWKVYNRFKRHQDKLDVVGRQGKSDILFVVDNSESMKSEQQKISRRFDRFINQITGLDWHIGITTTDANHRRAWGDGKLHAFENGASFLTSQIGVDKAQELFSKRVRREESGSPNEQGIRATFRAIERSMDTRETANQELNKFFRKDASLAVVLVSDEDESGSSDRSDPKHLMRLIKKKWGSDKIFQFNSIIVHTQKCLSGEGFSYGRKYQRLSEDTDGIVGDICANNYSKILKDIGKNVSSLHKVHKLKCEPQDIDKDGIIDLEITAKNQQPLPGYAINKSQIEFDSPLDPGEYNFHYFCLN